MAYLKYILKRASLALLAATVFVPVYLLSLTPRGGDGDRASASPVRHEDVPRRRYLPGLSFLAPAALALFLGAYLLVPAPGDSSGSVGPVRIENVRIIRLPQGSSRHIEVEIELRNQSQAGYEVGAWWFLTRLGAPEPWNFYAFRSSTQTQALASGERVTLRWKEEVTAEPGTYELSAWVHTLEGDVPRHSDGRGLGKPTIRIDGNHLPFTRRATPAPGLQVSAVNLPDAALDGGLTVPTELPLTIVITNDTAVETVADVQWFLYRQASRIPWNDNPAYSSRVLRHRVFAPNRQTTITTSEPISLWPGKYIVRVVVTEAAGEGSVASDDLFLNDPITVLENEREDTIIRPGPALGPVEIASVTTDTASFQRGTGSVTVNLRNRSDSEQEAIVWWYLARPGALQPWVEFDLQSKVFSTKIAPRQQTILSLSDAASPPPGTYELSVWVHTLDEEGEEHPSDGAWFNSRIEIH